jgi:hypothetical protein
VHGPAADSEDDLNDQQPPKKRCRIESTMEEHIKTEEEQELFDEMQALQQKANTIRADLEARARARGELVKVSIVHLFFHPKHIFYFLRATKATQSKWKILTEIEGMAQPSHSPLSIQFHCFAIGDTCTVLLQFCMYL